MAITHTSGRTLVSIMEAADRVGVCRRTIYTWISRGWVDILRLPSGKIRIFEDTLYRKVA